MSTLKLIGKLGGALQDVMNWIREDMKLLGAEGLPGEWIDTAEGQQAFKNAVTAGVQSFVMTWKESLKAKAQAFLRLIAQNLALKATNGKHPIADAKELFTAGIDGDFVNWGLNKIQATTEAIITEVHQLVKNGTYEQMFKSLGRSLDELVMTQSQIIDFCLTHREWLSKNCTFFLIKEGDEYFVASVLAYSDGRLAARVDRLSNDYVWRAGRELRLVVPQPQQKLGSS